MNTRGIPRRFLWALAQQVHGNEAAVGVGADLDDVAAEQVGNVEPEGRLAVVGEPRLRLVTIHREQVDPAVCYVGRVVRVVGGRVCLLEIRPDASWEEPTPYRMSEITHVDFGGDYENALLLMGGKGDVASKKPGRTQRR